MSGGDKFFNVPTDPNRIDFNRAKNRYLLPDEEEFHASSYRPSFEGDNDEAWATILDKEKLAGKIGERKSIQKQPLPSTAYALSGYILEAVPGGAESCNCSQPKDYADVHVYISPKPGPVPKSECIIAEITPRMRIKLGHEKDWTASEINKTYKGKCVHVEGWLLYDWEHTDVSFNEIEEFNKNKPKNIWRKTCWEIHPLTDLRLDENQM